MKVLQSTFGAWAVGFIMVAVTVSIDYPSSAQLFQDKHTAKPWTLVWSDEFNAVSGSALDSKKWTVVTGGTGWSHNELEYYTDRRENLRQENGNLVMEVRKENYIGPDGVSKTVTSARLKTQNKFEVKYGRIEARMKLPLGKGLWPAFWMLGSDHEVNRWPGCGEIDIMENIGDSHRVYSTLHGPGYSGHNGIQSHYDLREDEAINTDFHVYAAEWEPGEIRFYVDDHLYATQIKENLPAGTTWVFDHPFYILLNLAVGGPWPGYPDESTVLPQQMLVDYVRVYSR